ncbi:AsmA family protein [Leptospira interrogans]
MNGVLLWFAGLLVVLIGALFAVPHAVDWNSYRGTFEQEASRMLGREVRVGGDVTLRLLPVPYVSFDKPRIADADIGEAFIRADSFTMWLALPPLIQGIIEAKQIEVKRPTLRLQIDKQGGGNWQQLQVNPGSLPFVPRGITLQSVKITDGVVGLYAADGGELARVEIPDGEFSAPALAGPYRFRADLKWGGVARELRGSTAAPEADGSFRLKAIMRVPSTVSTYTFEGAIHDPGGKPRGEGDISVAVARERSFAPRPVTEGAGQEQDPVSQNAFEVRARLTADTLGAKLSDIAFSFEQAGRPQLLTGTAEAGWQGARTFRANLESKWLDLEKISAAPADANAFETARRLSVGLIDLLPKQGEVAARIAIDQANFAGDSISGLALAVEDRGLGLKVKEMRATLPGGVRVDFSGEVDRGGIAEGLRGDLLMRGSSLGRLLGWATRGAVPVPAVGDTGFSLTSVLYLNPTGVELRQGTLDAGVSRFAGDFGYKWGSRRALALSVESRKADISGVLPGALKAGLSHLLTDPEKRESGSWPGLADFDARIRVRADVLSDGSQVLNDVDTEILLQDGGLSIPLLRAATPAGFKIDLSGDVKELATEPKGSLRGVVAAASEPAMREVIQLAAIDTQKGLGQGLARLAPMRLAVVAGFGSGDDHHAQLSLDGMALGKPLVANVTLKGGWSGWRSAPMDAMVLAEGAQVVRLGYDALTGASVVNASPGNADREGRLLLKAVGIPAERMDTLVQVAVDDVKVDARGHVSIPDDLSLRFDGQAEVAVPDAVEAFTFAGLSPPAAAVGLGLQGKLGVAVTETGLRLKANRFELGKSRVSGEINLSGSQDARRIDATLNADEVSLPRLLAFVLDGSRAPTETDDALASNWREEPFDFDNLEHVRGTIKLQTDALTLEEGFGLSAATVEADIEPGKVSVTKLEGRALGGAVSSAFKIEKGAAGAGVTGVFGLFDIRLDQIVGATETPVGAGSANMNVQFSGQAVTPRALISVMTGKGELELKSASMERLSPNAVEATTEAVLLGRVVGSGDGLKQELRRTLATGPLSLGTRTVPVILGEGALRIDALSVETPAAVVTNRTTIDLGELKIDSEWRFQPTAASRARQASLPGISVIQVGPLLSYASLEPRIISDALERELAVRQMERNVEQLERLRREDEARAKAEAERLRAAERERLQRMQSGPQIEVPFPVPAPQSMQPQPSAPGLTAQQPAVAVPKAEPIEMTPLPAPRPAPAPRRPPPENSQWPPRW